MNAKPSTPMVEWLRPIWRRVLQPSVNAPRISPSASPDDNFFALGGNIRLADTLFAEIRRHLGPVLPSATIYHAQTLAALAAILDQPPLPRSPFVKLKDGERLPPILIMHGLSGNLPFFKLAREIQTQHPIFGVQARGVDGLQPPLDSIEEMAALYLESIHEVQDRGPYIFIGYSFGGLVALEMAQRVAAAGGEIAMLALIDAYPSPRYLPLSLRLQLIARRALNQRLLRERLARAASFATRAKYHGSPSYGSHSDNQPPSPLSFASTSRRVKKSAYLALARYQPRFYPGKIHFVKGTGDTYFPLDPAAVWTHLATEFESQTIPGGHLDMITTGYEGLAAVLTGYLSKALPHRNPQRD